MVNIGGSMAYQVSDSDGTLSYMTNDSSGIRQFGDVESVFVSGYGMTTATMTLSPPMTFAPAQFTVGQQQTSTGLATIVYQYVTTVDLNYTATATAMGTEYVTVPSGTYLAIKLSVTLNMSGYINGTYQSISDSEIVWVVDGIGSVQEIVTAPDGTTETYALVSTNLTQTTTTTTTTITATAPPTTTTATATTSTTTTTASTTSTTLTGGGTTANLVSGWNLLGNGMGNAITVSTMFGNASFVSTVWKWIASIGAWAFYTPTLVDGGAVYATSKGYTFLTTINAGEGFWVNANSAFSAPLSGSAVATATFKDSLTGPNPLPAGWSLISIADGTTPRAFTNNIALMPPTAGTVAANSVTTLWAWDSSKSNWYFYAPSLDNSDSLTSYIASKNYLDFGAANKTLGPSTGFWVNHP